MSGRMLGAIRSASKGVSLIMTLAVCVNMTDVGERKIGKELWVFVCI